jgi:uroporphyrinogen III methyltransferase/synthase
VPRQLSAAGAEVTQIEAYRSVDVTQPDAHITKLLQTEKIDWITVTSSAIARSLHAMFGPLLESCQLVSISPITSRTLHELGLPVAAEAKEATMSGIVAAILRAERDRGKEAAHTRDWQDESPTG